MNLTVLKNLGFAQRKNHHSYHYLTIGNKGGTLCTLCYDPLLKEVSLLLGDELDIRQQEFYLPKLKSVKDLLLLISILKSGIG